MEKKHLVPQNLFPNKSRFFVLLVSLLLFSVINPFLVEYTRIKFLMTIFFSVILFSGLYAASRKKSGFVVALIIAIPMFTAEWADNFVQIPHLSLVAKILGAIFFAYTAIIILSYIYSEKEVTSELIYGAVCAYFLMGLMWACVFFTLEMLQPGSFHTAQDIEISYSHFTYYSFVTLTTLGYGDITPLSYPARSLSTIEAVTGQLYLAVMIAGLVGIYISQSRK